MRGALASVVRTTEIDRFRAVRDRTVSLCAPLSTEDHGAQSMPDASPIKWHLGHTTWFFETFVLAGQPPFDPAFARIYNSYYDTLGDHIDRPSRALLTRPSLDVVHAYRAHGDAGIERQLGAGGLDAEARTGLELGIAHEQQHQELMLTDLKHLFATQALRPAYRPELPRPVVPDVALGWLDHPGGVVSIGAPGTGFAFDLERPRHRVVVEPFRLATRVVTCGEVLGFIDAGGYQEPRLWLADGWVAARTAGWTAPLYWDRTTDGWAIFELAGARALDPAEPACHLSLYEADAIARWLGARLPTEAEWELAASPLDPDVGNFADDDVLHPRPPTGAGLRQMFGDVWEWTSSAYAPYPGFQPLPGALGEYNGKFMSGQYVLRGGSCLTPRGHVRASYRNFFPPATRWQMSGVRLAGDAGRSST
jgi:ergothioneine biosynthesis protein EgtB